MKMKITLRRIAAVIMCTCFLSCAVSSLLNASITDARTGNSAEALASQEIKARLLQQITEEGWNPYSADMTLEEFYALMELVEEGALSLDSSDTSAISAYSALGMAVPYTEETASGILIPRKMFLLSGLTADSGLDDYNNEAGSEGDIYPPGLDRYGVGYKLPPQTWPGVGVKTDKDTGAMRAAVIVDGINDSDSHVAGDVDQELFPKLDGYYVKSVSAEGADVSILGVIDKGNGEYVYYYMSTADQSTLVSSTTLPAEAKFIINYSPNEHAITYKIEMSDGSNVPANITLDSVFGATRPTKTVDAAYSFDVIAPYGYTARVFREANGNIIELTGTDLPEASWVNNGYPLGAEPVYTIQNGKQVPDTGSGPSAMTRNATFYNDLVKEDRTVVAVLTKRDAPPLFNAYNLLPKIDNTKGRGTSAFYKVKAKDRETGEEIEVLYDYEDVYEWANGRPSKYDYVESSITSGGANKGNVKDGNVATADRWGWDKDVDVTNNAKMDYDEGTDSYSYQWTFQTNSSSGGYTLDTLEINGVAIRIPYLPKQTNGNNETTGADGGIRTWVTEGTLPDGAAVRVEFLMSFNSNPQQRVYRIIVTGAHSNVTLTNMNLIQGIGAPEMSVYNLAGVHADTGNTTSQLPMIEYYSVANDNIQANQWYKGNLADVCVNQPNYGGDENNHGANIRFKLADGYGEPFYLYESYLGNVINGQASAQRMADGITFDNAQKVQPLPEDDSEKLSSQYIYGPDNDGWYYIRLTTQESNKFALLTIVARPVRYVVRYMPGADFPEEEHNGETFAKRPPANMPTFDHSNSDSSFQDSPYGGQYDDNNGFYYDTVTNNKISITTIVPNDPKNWYKFVDWVIVDAEGNPVQAPPKSQTVSLYSDETEGEDNSIHITSNRALDVNDVNEYSIENDGLGGNAVSVRVIRLMPTWKAVQNPFKYSVVVDWVDSLGELHQEHFDEYWDDILTDSTDDALTVFVNKDAEPLQRWLAEHPTYGFWDEVNNAVDDKDYVPPEDPPEPEATADPGISGISDDPVDPVESGNPEPEATADPNSPKSAKQKIEASMNDLYPELAKRVDAEKENSLYNTVLRELLKTDISGGLEGNEPNGEADFSRLGGYAFSVHENGGKIVIWMCEKKSGLEIRSELEGDAFIGDEEIYYTFNAVSGGKPLEGIYKVYPEGYVDKKTGRRMILRKVGTEVIEDILMDTDAWLVKFENGSIADIIHNNGEKWHTGDPGDERVRYFAAKHNGDDRENKGIILYAPVGEYTVTQAGSKSGGAYNVKLDYYDWTDVNDRRLPPFRFVEIQEPEGEQWTWGKNTEYIHENVDSPEYSQVSPGITYEAGSNNRLYVIQFTNRTSSLTIGNEVKGSSDSNIAFSYEVKLKLSDKIKPLKKDGKDYYYFNYTPYLLGTEVEDGDKGEIKLSPIDDDPDGFNWSGTVEIKNHRQLRIITSVPEQPDSNEQDIIKTLAIEEDDPEGTDSEQTIPANYSVHEDRGNAEEKYPLTEITASSSTTVSVDDSNAAGTLGAVESHSIIFRHVPTLPETGGRGVGLICISGILLIAAGLWLLSSKKTVI